MEHRRSRRRITAAALSRSVILVVPAGRRVGAGVTLSAHATAFGALGPTGWMGAGAGPTDPAAAGAALAAGHVTLPCLSEPQGIGAGAVSGADATGF